MAGQWTSLGGSKSLVGTSLVGLGVVILCENLASVVSHLSYVLDANGFRTLGVLPSGILSVARVLQAHALDHQQFLQSFLQHMLISSWPLVLVIVGTVLWRDGMPETASVVARNNKCGKK